jgi:hypothetical protein
MERHAMDRRREIIDRLRNQLPVGVGADIEIHEELSLVDLGLNSLHLITTLLELQREYGLGDEWFADARAPCTVAELVSLVESGLTDKAR